MSERDPYAWMESVTDALNAFMGNRLLFGCFTVVFSLVVLALYISYRGPVM